MTHILHEKQISQETFIEKKKEAKNTHKHKRSGPPDRLIFHCGKWEPTSGISELSKASGYCMSTHEECTNCHLGNVKREKEKTENICNQQNI